MNQVAWGERVGGTIGVGDLVPAGPGWTVVEFSPGGIQRSPLVGWIRVRSRTDVVGWCPGVMRDGIIQPPHGEQFIVRPSTEAELMRDTTDTGDDQ